MRPDPKPGGFVAIRPAVIGMGIRHAAFELIVRGMKASAAGDPFHRYAGAVARQYFGFLFQRQAIEQPTFVEQGGLRRVEVFGIVLGIDDAPAEGDGATAPVANREHNAVPKAIVGFAVVLENQHAGGNKLLLALAIGAQLAL